MIPSGSKVIGHVTQATARSKGAPDSTLGMVFDKIEISKGKDLPMNGVIQSVAPSLGEKGPTTGGAGSNVLWAHDEAGTSAGTTPAPMPTNNDMNSHVAVPIVIATSQGVLGVKNLQLDAHGVLSSPGKEVKLDNGMQMLIRAESAHQ